MFKKYEPFDPFTPYDANLLLRQGTIEVANVAERDAITDPVAGMRAYRADKLVAEEHTGVGWLPAVRRFGVNSDAERDAHFGKPETEPARLALQARGVECVRRDKGWTERYFATYDPVTNPVGATSAGWYPVEGGVLRGRVNAVTDTGWLTVGTPGAIPFQSGWSGITNASVPWAGVRYRLFNNRVDIHGPCRKEGGFGSLVAAFIMPPEMRPSVTAVGVGQVDGTAAYVIVTPDGSVKTTGGGTSQFSIGVSYPVGG